MARLTVQSSTQTQPIPNALEGERPTQYADRLGRFYTSKLGAQKRKELGIFLTPISIADHMASLVSLRRSHIRMLDPDAGAGILACAATEKLVRDNDVRTIEVSAFEIEPGFLPILDRALEYLRAWAACRGVSLAFTVRGEDFVAGRAHLMADRLLSTDPQEQTFDLVIANPPYFKIQRSDPRAQVASKVVRGQPNIYALFLAVSASLLVREGQSIFITPRSFASGDYFRLFREWYFDRMRPDVIHVFTSRRDAFQRDAVLQENVILKATKDSTWMSYGDHMITLSSSRGTTDLAEASGMRLALRSVLNWTSRDRVLHLPVSRLEEQIMVKVSEWPESLATLGLKISTGPVVPFRATDLLDDTGEVPNSHFPLIWMRNVRAMDVQWPHASSVKQFIKNTAKARPLLLRDKNYVVLRRFSAKEERRRLTAAPLLAGTFHSDLIGLENHLNYIHRAGGEIPKEEAYGLAALLNSSIMDIYFRTLSGNTQVSASEMRILPLPPADVITAIGRRALEILHYDLDDIVRKELLARGLW